MTPADAPPVGAASGGDERGLQYGKRALVVGAILGALVVGGLLVDALHSPGKPQAPAAAESSRPSAPRDPFLDFEAKQRMEAARLESERQRKLAQAKQRPDPRLPEAADDNAAVRAQEEEAREAAHLEDLKRALAAVRSREMTVARTDRERGGAAGDAKAGARVGSPSPRNVAQTDAGKGVADAALSRLRLAVDRIRGDGSPDVARGDDVRFVRDLRGSAATGVVVGQSASTRRERGEAQRPGEYLVPAGTVMSALLDIEINSDWEGRWRALIARDVYDLSQDVILIPKGTRVLGTAARPKPVNEAINERMALTAQWLVLPNGARIDLSRSAMLDGAGIAAIEGDVNRHFLATLGGVVAYGVISGWGASQAAKAADRNVAAGLAVIPLGGRTAGAEIALGLADIGKRVASRYLNLVPTITLKPGTPMNIFLDDEMLLQAWAPIDEFAPAVATPSMR